MKAIKLPDRGRRFGNYPTYGSHDCFADDRHMEQNCDTFSMEGKGVEGDWVQFLWNLHSTYAKSYSPDLDTRDIADIYADSDPENWTDSTQYQNYVYDVLKDAAMDYMSEAIWNTIELYNGINH